MSAAGDRGAGMGGAASARNFDFVVVGAGTTGAVMASLLVALKIGAPGRVAILADHTAPPATTVAETEWDLRVFALSRASQRVLEICGAWRRLPPGKACAYERMIVWDSRGDPGGHGSLRFDCAELGEPNLGFIVEGRALHSQCLRAATEAGVAMIEAAVAGISIEDTCARIILRDGREVRSQLLIAADGADSAVRNLLGIETAGHAYSQDALVAHVRTARPHQHTAWQRFLPAGPLAFLPLPDGRSSIVWSAERADAARLRALDGASFGAALTAASGGVLGDCELTTPLACFALKLQFAADYVRPRAALVGDAAHAVHPLAGQGLNLGLLDCASLAEVLSEKAGNASFGDYKSLRRYERWRRTENMLAGTAMDALERLFSTDNPALSQLRVAGLSVVDRLPSIKNRLVRRAMGLRGDLPRFLLREGGFGD